VTGSVTQIEGQTSAIARGKIERSTCELTITIRAKSEGRRKKERHNSQRMYCESRKCSLATRKAKICGRTGENEIVETVHGK